MTSLRVICGLGPPQSKILATPMHSGYALPSDYFPLTWIISTDYIRSIPICGIIEQQGEEQSEHCGVIARHQNS